jgi:hypothetical protein
MIVLSDGFSVSVSMIWVIEYSIVGLFFVPPNTVAKTSGFSRRQLTKKQLTIMVSKMRLLSPTVKHINRYVLINIFPSSVVTNFCLKDIKICKVI